MIKLPFLELLRNGKTPVYFPSAFINLTTLMSLVLHASLTPPLPPLHSVCVFTPHFSWSCFQDTIPICRRRFLHLFLDGTGRDSLDRNNHNIKMGVMALKWLEDHVKFRFGFSTFSPDGSRRRGKYCTVTTLMYDSAEKGRDLFLLRIVQCTLARSLLVHKNTKRDP